MSAQTTPSIFSFNSSSVRTFADHTGEPLFVGKDVCVCLGYSDPTNAMKQHCKGVVKRHPLQTPGGIQQARVLAEPDVLRLIVGSKLPTAVEFERLVFDEILPSIRRTGRYEGARQGALPLLDAVTPVTQAQADALSRLFVDRFPNTIHRAAMQARVFEHFGIQAIGDLSASKLAEACSLVSTLAEKVDDRAAKCRENGKKGGRPPKTQGQKPSTTTKSVSGFGPTPAKRQDLSFSGIDTDGKVDPWIVNNRRTGQLLTDLGIGNELFKEIAALAKKDEREAHKAIHFALGGETRWDPKGGIEWGFARALAAAAIIGLRVMRSGTPAYDPGL